MATIHEFGPYRLDADAEMLFRGSEPVALGLQPETLEGARVFVLPNPSGRNANFSYAEMAAAFRALRRTTRPHA